MTTWNDVDAWVAKRTGREHVEHRHEDAVARRTKAERAKVSRLVRLEEQGELRAFASTVLPNSLGLIRFRCRPRGIHIHVERPCYFVRGKWRAHATLPVRGFVEAAMLQGLTRTQAESVLVERDRWLDDGAPRRTRLPEV